MILENVLFLDENFKKINRVMSGQKVILETKYSNPNLQELSLSVGFFDEFMNFLFACRSDTIDFIVQEKEGTAYLEINKWPLSQGTYTYNIAVHHKKIMIQNEKGIGHIRTEKGDFYGTGKLPGKRKGFYVDYNWYESN